MDTGHTNFNPRIVTNVGQQPLRVLVVDDESTIRLALRRFFLRLGWEVDEAPSGEEAIAKLLDEAEGQSYRLVICDLRLPGLSGIELHDAIAAARPELLSRLIFSTGDLVSEEVASFIETTHCLVLQKPFELSALLDTVQRMKDTRAITDSDHQTGTSG